ncbi:UNVERIFIED_CONTAM: hypothetical protein FKN15_040475 [Acipenser sinensis]
MGGASSSISGSGGSSVSGIAGSTISGGSGSISITSGVNRPNDCVAIVTASKATVANASGANLRAYYSTKDMQLSEIVGAKNAFKPDSPEFPYLRHGTCAKIKRQTKTFNPGEGFFANVLVEGTSTPSICAGIIAENFQVRPGSSVIITACRKIVPRKSDQDNEWVDEDGNNHKTASD